MEYQGGVEGECEVTSPKADLSIERKRRAKEAKFYVTMYYPGLKEAHSEALNE